MLILMSVSVRLQQHLLPCRSWCIYMCVYICLHVCMAMYSFISGGSVSTRRPHLLTSLLSLNMLNMSVISTRTVSPPSVPSINFSVITEVLFHIYFKLLLILLCPPATRLLPAPENWSIILWLKWMTNLGVVIMSGFMSLSSDVKKCYGCRPLLHLNINCTYMLRYKSVTYGKYVSF